MWASGARSPASKDSSGSQSMISTRRADRKLRVGSSRSRAPNNSSGRTSTRRADHNVPSTKPPDIRSDMCMNIWVSVPSNVRRMIAPAGNHDQHERLIARYGPAIHAHVGRMMAPAKRKSDCSSRRRRRYTSPAATRTCPWMRSSSSRTASSQASHIP
jgi:hypothetical protein